MSFKIMIEAPYACFTRPEFKVERMTYEVPTPGALEGMLKSIYWKPAIRYVIDKIIVFNDIQFANLRRNEVTKKVLLSSLTSQMKGKPSDPCIYTKECRNQRNTVMLTNVKYGIEFHFELTGLKSEKAPENQDQNKKHYSIIANRLKEGQCFQTPYLGCRELVVKKLELVEEFDYNEIHKNLLNCDIDLGYMLYHMEFKDKGIPTNNDWDRPEYSDEADAIYYNPHLINGIIDVEKYRKELKC